MSDAWKSVPRLVGEVVELRAMRERAPYNWVSMWQPAVHVHHGLLLAIASLALWRLRRRVSTDVQFLLAALLGAAVALFQLLAQLVTQDEACSPANPMFTTIDQPGVGPHLAAGLPLNFSGMQRLPAGNAPTLGQHTDQVLYELLGVSQAQFGVLRERGVV